MSVYKAIGTYFSDYYNYLDKLNTKHGSLQILFENISNLDYKNKPLNESKLKHEIVTQLYQLLVNIDIAFDTEKTYWEGILKEQKLFVFMNTFLIIVSTILCIFFIYELFKNNKVELTFEISKKIIIYITIYYVVLAVTILLIISIRSKIKLCKGQLSYLERLRVDFLKLPCLSAVSTNFNFIFLMLGYYLKNNKKKAKLILKKYIPTGQPYGILQFYLDNDPKVIQDREIAKKQLAATEGRTYEELPLEVEMFNIFTDDIINSVKAFHANGLESIRNEIIKNSPVHLLKEARNITQFYELAAFPPVNVNEELDEKNQEDFEKSMIQDIIKQIDSFYSTTTITNTSTTDTTDTKDTKDTKDTTDKTDTTGTTDTTNMTLEMLVNKIISQLNNNEIELKIYKQYSLSLIENLDISTENIPNITNVINAIIDKQDFKNSLNNDLDARAFKDKFKTQKQFNDFINELSFDELEDKLKPYSFSRMITNYYSTISESINLKRNDMTNIHFTKQQNIKLLNQAKIIVIVGSSVLFCYFVLEIAEDIITIKKQKSDYCINKYNITNWIIKCILYLSILIAVIFLIISITKNYEAINNFNSDIIETNTYQLKNHLINLKDLFDEIKQKNNINTDPNTTTTNTNSTGNEVQNAIIYKPLGSYDAVVITEDQRFTLFTEIKEIIDRFNKCNFLVDGSSNLPLPLLDILLNGVLIIAAVVLIVIVTLKLRPINILFKLQVLFKYKEKLTKSLDFDIQEEIEFQQQQHSNDFSDMSFILKIVFYTLLIIFILYYSIQTLISTDTMRAGLYNSAFYQESICY